MHIYIKKSSSTHWLHYSQRRCVHSFAYISVLLYMRSLLCVLLLLFLCFFSFCSSSLFAWALLSTSTLHSLFYPSAHSVFYFFPRIRSVIYPFFRNHNVFYLFLRIHNVFYLFLRNHNVIYFFLRLRDVLYLFLRNLYFRFLFHFMSSLIVPRSALFIYVLPFFFFVACTVPLPSSFLLRESVCACVVFRPFCDSLNPSSFFFSLSPVLQHNLRYLFALLHHAAPTI